MFSSAVFSTSFRFALPVVVGDRERERRKKGKTKKNHTLVPTLHQLPHWAESEREEGRAGWSGKSSNPQLCVPHLPEHAAPDT